MPYEGRYRLSVAHLLVALVAMFVVQPFVDHMAYGYLVASVFFTIVLLVAVNAVGGQRRSQIAAALLAAPAVGASWLQHVWPDSLLNDFYFFFSIVFIIYVIVHLFRFVVFAPSVNDEVLCASIAIYLLLAVAWALLYTLLALWDPGAIIFTEAADAHSKLEGFKSLYFSVQIITTITFGDIMPISDTARMLALVEATFGMFYLAILVSRLVGAYTGRNDSN
ncbi:potassium channel family protein [Bythopirellula polymerisocia]|uniref:Ion channel n=1 Tax=Bythopirellula polymerisocia TaxID=2528003 RepID=A0A5C6CYG9_9BACT|nr:potassium channel family protein [Bythopirellula polymerisocia]TWU29610.1 Ion channel [Bythopirellula polymerisocia]